MDQMFKATVLINVLYGLLVCYDASVSDLSLVQCFLKRCHMISGILFHIQ